MLKAEGWMYVVLAGKWKKYGSHMEAFRKFAGKMGSALLEETERCVRVVVSEPTADTATDQGGDQNSRSGAARAARSITQADVQNGG
jgi:hypothetical protein